MAVERQYAPGPMHGAVSIEGRGDGHMGTLRVEFQNEYLPAAFGYNVEYQPLITPNPR